MQTFCFKPKKIARGTVITRERPGPERDFLGFSGFSLIEVLVALSILVIGLFAIFKAFPLGLSGINRDVQKINSTLLAQEKMEELESLDYDELLPGIIEPRHDLGGDFTGFERESRVALLDSDLKPSDSDQKLKLIEVTVWAAKSFGSGSTTLKTIVSKK